MNKPLSREEKINLLQAIAKGEVTISSIMPTSHSVSFFHHYDDGVYKNLGTGEQLSEEQFKGNKRPYYGSRKPLHTRHVIIFQNMGEGKWLSTSPDKKI